MEKYHNGAVPESRVPIGRLAQALSTVAIAGLSGGLATAAGTALGAAAASAGVAVLGELARHTWARLGSTERDLSQRVAATIVAWANREGFEASDRVLGLELATVTLSSCGLGIDAFADLNFNAEKARDKVLDLARKRARSHWGGLRDWADEALGREEDHHVIAAAAIRETYAAVAACYYEDQPGLMAALRATRNELDKLARDVGTSTRASGDLVSMLTAGAETGDVTAYLRARIDDWDRSVWHEGRSASSLERPIRVLGPGVDGIAGAALVGQQRVVLLGGPGSGKTWLAHGIARIAAQRALRHLENGGLLSEVEIPVFTTWTQWSQTAGSTRGSLIDSSFTPHTGQTDLGPGGITERLRRTLSDSHASVLMVVDSLDEAADKEGQDKRLRALLALPGWRVVVTSRESAWKAHLPEPNATLGASVVRLQDLRYPEDVEGFIHDWFSEDPIRGEALRIQLRDRADLRRLASVPLLLTIYCHVADGGSGAVEPLPALRRDLYRRLTRRLLQGRWAQRGGPEADNDYCHALLTRWARHVARNGVSPAGLGAWADRFTQPERPRIDQARAVDHIAPRVDVDEEGLVARRFVHRTLLEHFVAEHIAGLNATDAANALLPHLWFDPDWETSAAAAIAAHPDRVELLGLLLEQAAVAGDVPAKAAANSEIDKLLLRVAAESTPDQWPSQEQRLLHRLRVHAASSLPWLVTSSRHWTESNMDAAAAIVAGLPRAGSQVRAVAATNLRILGANEQDRSFIFSELMRFVDEPPDDGGLGLSDPLGSVVEALTLASSPRERSAAFASLVGRLPDLAEADLGIAGRTLATLADNDEQRDEATTALLLRLRKVHNTSSEWFAAPLAAALQALARTDQQRADSFFALVRFAVAQRHRVTNLESTVGPGARAVVVREDRLSALMDALEELVPESLRAQLASESISRIPEFETDPPRFGNAVALLGILAKMEPQRSEAVEALLNPVVEVLPSHVDTVAAALHTLGLTSSQRGVAVAALLRFASDVHSVLVGKVAYGLAKVATTDQQRSESVAALLPRLGELTPQSTAKTATALGVLAGQEQREEVISALIDRLREVSALDVHPLVEAMQTLALSGDHQDRVVDTLLYRLSGSGQSDTGPFVSALTTLALSDQQRSHGSAALVARVADCPPNEVYRLAGSIDTLAGTDQERSDAFLTLVSRLSDVLPPRSPGSELEAAAMLRALANLAIGANQRAVLVDALLDCLSEMDARPDGGSLGNANKAERRARFEDPDIRSMKTGELLRSIRRILPTEQWIAWLDSSDSTLPQEA